MMLILIKHFGFIKPFIEQMVPLNVITLRQSKTDNNNKMIINPSYFLLVMYCKESHRFLDSLQYVFEYLNN